MEKDNNKNLREAMLISGESRKMKEIYQLIDKIAPTNVNVLIYGETGCGKETLAKIIHKRSKKVGNFTIIDPLQLNSYSSDINKLEDILVNTIKLAKDGTVLIDDIADANHKTQMQLMKILNQKNEYNIRVVATTSRDLLALAFQRRFRQDLCNILDVVSISIPPLRDRKDDIAILSGILLKEIVEENGINKVILKEVIDLFISYNWPGNVRELENVLISAYISSGESDITIHHLPLKLRRKNAFLAKATTADELYRFAKGLMESGVHSDVFSPYNEYIKVVEIPLIKAAMDSCKGNKSAAALLLRINRNTLSKKLKDYNIE